MNKLLIANRGEVAVRIVQAAHELGLATVSVYSEDDADSLHVQMSDTAVPLQGSGPAAYLDGQQHIDIAKAHRCTMLHPGYGFLSESAAFAKACAEAGVIFVGPSPEALMLLGDKAAARQLAQEAGVPILQGRRVETAVEAQTFWEGLGADTAVMLKAVSGGGGRGMRHLTSPNELEASWQACQAEAQLAFGEDALYVEQFLPLARHVEVQLVGDGERLVALGERECSLQRRRQKLVEFAPAPGISKELRRRLVETAVTLLQPLNYSGLCTVEFLVEGIELGSEANFYFIEANPRLQVEHTVTEEAYGVDLVQMQLQIVDGRSLSDILPTPPNAPIRMVMQMRLYAEKLLPNGQSEPGVGEVTQFRLPMGAGVRVESHAYAGYAPSPRFDPLLAKIICSVSTVDFEQLLRKGQRTLDDCRVAGLPTNLSFLQAILDLEAVQLGQMQTRLIDEQMETLLAMLPDEPTAVSTPTSTPEGWTAVTPTMPGSVTAVEVAVGDYVKLNQPLATIEAMKMEAVIEAPAAGVIQQIGAAVGQIVDTAVPLFLIEVTDEESEADGGEETAVDLDQIRPDLQALFDRRAFLLDQNRPEAVQKRHGRDQRTARENIADLCDPDSFVEVGSAVVAAQRSRRSLDDLIRRTPADGLICGFGAVNGDQFDAETAQCMVMAYDYTVLAGTQGALNHKKMDRMLKLAAKVKLPLILYAEGGGGRPGDVDVVGVAGLDVMTFTLYAGLSGKIPLITIVSGYCFAGNAALAGCADVLIATENSSIGMGGPAMIEGGGLGSVHPRDVGPAEVQRRNGVIDILVKDEVAATAVAKKLLSYHQGAVDGWTCADQRLLRRLIPENRRRTYDMRRVIETLADVDSVLELRRDFGVGIITALVRVEGRPLGIIANNPAHLGGAIDSDGADKAARFMQLCEAWGLPILSLVDTPGIMVGPEAEASGTVRHASRLFLVGASLTVPFFAVVLRKGYGLGAQAMCGGSFHVPFFTLAWPTGEFGAMGLEGAVRLGFRKELEAAENEAARQALFEKMVAHVYEQGKAINTASFMELDEVIDPAETRARLVAGLLVAGKGGGERPFVDSC